MGEWIRSALDILLIAMVAVGLYQVSTLIKHLRGLRQSRGEMEKFVYEFNATVMRAEAGIKGLRNAARDSGDDLEKLVEKAYLVRDELSFIVESADQLADRISRTASATVIPRAEAVARAEADDIPEAPATQPAAAKPAAPRVVEMKEASSAPTSRAEKELLQALQKLS